MREALRRRTGGVDGGGERAVAVADAPFQLPLLPVGTVTFLRMAAVGAGTGAVLTEGSVWAVRDVVGSTNSCSTSVRWRSPVIKRWSTY